MEKSWKDSIPFRILLGLKQDCFMSRMLTCSQVWMKNWLLPRARELAAELTAAGVRTDSDLRDNYTPGWKYNYWELKARTCGLGLSVSVQGND